MERVLPDLDDFRHWLPVQLRFNDIDILGHLNNIVYFSLYDLAKAMFIQSLRKEQIYWRKVDCVIANIDCAYIHPIYFGDQMEVATRCIHIGDRSFTLEQCLVEKSSRQIRSIGSHERIAALCPLSSLQGCCRPRTLSLLSAL